MSNEKEFSPIQFKGVMVSSTFADLETHRQELMKALRKEELFAIVMEEYVPIPGDDIISSSLDMVRKSSAYIGLISRRYGQIIEDPNRNPESYSISRLEFQEARRLELPTLIFVMGENHPVTESGVELDPVKRGKLNEYRELAKEGRTYVEFDSLDDFKTKAIHALARLSRYLREQDSSSQYRSPIQQPIEFYSCFISYSSNDSNFAGQLHLDLQNKDVRCWFAPEDLKIGDKFREKIYESISRQDKLLLILSKNSVKSTWVEDEVEATFEREERENRVILFPIRIDDYVLESEKAWARKIRGIRHIGDFTRWQDHYSYQKAFERLLRDLRFE